MRWQPRVPFPLVLVIATSSFSSAQWTACDPAVRVLAAKKKRGPGGWRSPPPASSVAEHQPALGPARFSSIKLRANRPAPPTVPEEQGVPEACSPAEPCPACRLVERLARRTARSDATRLSRRQRVRLIRQGER